MDAVSIVDEPWKEIKEETNVLFSIMNYANLKKDCTFFVFGTRGRSKINDSPLNIVDTLTVHIM